MAKNRHKDIDLQDLGFEAAITELTDIVEKIELGEIPLQDSLEQYEKGMNLIRHCRGILQQAEKRILDISQQSEPAE